ncbi:FtsX-like permease family protein [Streptomyces sp. H27-D2]|uniref:FtsX-like permease family protein n=1 Tax=Streptomyces sp. H27-D2 TaxID=3046304 RepID=UPI002DB5EF8B|nr:FtsX-like permease family protein [Streptomyces sp. H27-D2]MEC4015034.1 FtsX-like permease family protein [Streptomyces sp. H27-D2]
MALDPARLVARSLSRSWRQRPARMAAAIAAGIGGVLLTTAMLLVSASVLDAIKGASISGIRDNVVAVEARAPGGMSKAVVDRTERETGVRGSRALVISTSVATKPGGDTTPIIVFGVDQRLGNLTDKTLADEISRTRLGPDEVFLSAVWADDHAVGKGDVIHVGSPTGMQTWKVAGLLNGEVANRGAVVIAPLPSVATAFDRGDNSDVLLLDPGKKSRGEIAAVAQKAVDGAADIKHPGDLLSGYSKTFRTSLTILGMFAVIAVLTAAVVLFLTWRLALDDARKTLARMRLFGVRTKHLMLGSAAVMVPLLLGTYVIGAGLGVFVGTLLGSFTQQITDLTQQAVTPGLPWQWPVAGAFVAAVLMFAVAWLSGVRRFTKITAIEAVTGRDQIALMPGGAGPRFVAGFITLAIGTLLVALGGDMVKSTSLVFLFIGAALLSVVLPVMVGTLLRKGDPGAVRLAVSRHLQLGWRRNVALSITFTVAVVTSVAMAGVSSSIKNDVASSVERWTQGELFVQAAPVGQNLQNEKFPISLEKELRDVDGVDAVTSFSYANVGLDGRKVQVWSWGAQGDSDKLTKLKVSKGAKDFIHTLGTDEIAISSNFGRTRDLSVGDTMDLPLPSGHRTVRVKSVLEDSASDGGMIVAGTRLYEELTATKGVYAFYIGVKDGADVGQVQSALEKKIGDRYPRAHVPNQTEMRDAFAGITARLVSAFEAFAWVMFLLAVLVGAATLASGLVERQRGLALTRLAGATKKAINRQLVAESVLIAFSSWIVALPVGCLAIPAMLDAQAGTSGLLPPITVPMLLSVLSLPLVVLCMLLALAVANPRRANPPLRELLAQE